MIELLTVGKRIARCRKNCDLTQAELADQLGFSTKHLSAIERGKVRLNLDTLYHIANILNVDILTFLSDADSGLPSYGMSEIQEITKNWSPVQKEILIQMIIHLDKMLRSN